MERQRESSETFSLRKEPRMEKQNRAQDELDVLLRQVPLRHQTDFFSSSEQAFPPRNSLRGARPPGGSACASDTTPDGERGARSRARASCVVPRRSRRLICPTEPRQTRERKASTNIGSSTAVNARGTHQTLTRHVRRAGGVERALVERVSEAAASQACASSSVAPRSALSANILRITRMRGYLERHCVIRRPRPLGS